MDVPFMGCCTTRSQVLRTCERVRHASAIVEPSEKSKKPINAARGLYKHQRARVVSMQCTYTENLVLESLHGPAKPAHCSQGLRV